MKKEFTNEQLVLIRDIFADQLDKSLNLGHRDQAQEELDIINVTQSKLNCEEYKDLNQFRKDDTGTWDEVGKPEADETEEAAIQAMIRWAKSDETEVTDEIQAAIDAYCNDHWANTGRCDEDVVENRKIAINGLIIGSIYALDSAQLAKLDTILKPLARHIPPKEGLALNSYEFTILDTETKKRFTVSSTFEDADQAKQWAVDNVVEPYSVDVIREDGYEIYRALYEGKKLTL